MRERLASYVESRDPALARLATWIRSLDDDDARLVALERVSADPARLPGADEVLARLQAKSRVTASDVDDCLDDLVKSAVSAGVELLAD